MKRVSYFKIHLVCLISSISQYLPAQKPCFTCLPIRPLNISLSEKKMNQFHYMSLAAFLKKGNVATFLLFRNLNTDTATVRIMSRLWAHTLLKQMFENSSGFIASTISAQIYRQRANCILNQRKFLFSFQKIIVYSKHQLLLKLSMETAHIWNNMAGNYRNLCGQKFCIFFIQFW